MSGTTACGCCAGIGPRTPLMAENRPGLSAVSYRVGTHADFMAGMLASLTSADRPRLAKLTTRDRDDLSIALLDAWATVADVLSFYTERLAQESYLRTARERVSVQELGKLVGHQLAPGAAAQTHLAFALERPPVVAASADPGATPPPPPTAVQLDAGLRVQSIPGPGEQPQTFETVEAISARPDWNAMRARTSTTFVPGPGDRHAWLAGTALSLHPGDALLFVGTDILGERWDVRVLTDVSVPDPAAGRTLVQWSEGLGSVDPYKAPATPPAVHVLRKRFQVFGHNAPMWATMPDSVHSHYPGATGSSTEWPDFTLSPTTNAVDVEGTHPEIVHGSWLVLDKPDYRELFTVGLVTEVSRAAFGISGAVTRVTLADGENYSLFADKVRETAVLAVSEPLTFASAPDDSPVNGQQLDVVAEATAMVPGRTLIVTGRTAKGGDHVETAVVASVEAIDGGTRLVLQVPLTASYARDTVVVHGNVAVATHGETVHQVLGSGDAAAAFQRFRLAHAPLTYVQDSSPTGVASTLEVRVNDVAWRQRPTLYGAGVKDKSYTVRTDAAGATVVQLGDGVHGARPATGGQNVRARYRKGIGATGNVGAGELAQLLDRPLGVKGVSNPTSATGGVDAERTEDARRTIPLAPRTLGRAVSLLDYEDFARAFTGVAKARAVVLPLLAGRTIVVTVALVPGSGVDATERLHALTDALHSYGDPLVHVAVVDHQRQDFHVGLRVVVDADRDPSAVLPAVEFAVRTAYSFDARELVQAVHRSEVVAVVHSVPGVTAVDITSLHGGTSLGDDDRLLAAQPAVGPGGTALPGGLLVLADGPFERLEAGT